LDLRTQPPECLLIGAARSGEKTGEVEGDSAENTDEYDSWRLGLVVAFLQSERFELPRKLPHIHTPKELK
jgi:hypothetical protein